MSTEQPFSGQALPQDLEAEQAVLGAMLISREAIVAAKLELPHGPDEFYAEKHQFIYRAIMTLFDKGKPVDTLTVRDALNKPVGQGEAETYLNWIGGEMYLVTLVNRTVTTANTAAYARMVANKAVNRRGIMAGLQIAARFREADRDTSDAEEATAAARADAEAELRKVQIPGEKGGLQSIGGIVDRAKSKLASMGTRNPHRLEFGLKEWDRFAWMRGEVLSIHAPSGNIKSTLTRQMMINLARRKVPCAYFALETYEEQMDDCLIAQVGRLSLHRIRNMDREPLSTEEAKRYLEAAEEIESLKAYMYLNHVPLQRWGDIRAKILQFAMQHGDVGALFIDYTDLVEKSNEKGESRHEQQLIRLHYEGKALAREVNALAVFIDQAPIEMLKRADPTPTMFDFEYAKGIPKACDHTVGLVLPANCKESQVGKQRIIPAFPVPKVGADPIPYNDRRWENVALAAYTKGRFARPGYLLPMYHHGPSGFIGNLARNPWDAPADQPAYHGAESPIDPQPQQTRLTEPRITL